ncbi:MAG TPA: tetratricopeptide repeat protein [Candidatus Limnocylindrales bacterium]|nr:tetratricopeptide repeat protein [Candidatus Limnocylindrales bacterium]
MSTKITRYPRFQFDLLFLSLSLFIGLLAMFLFPNSAVAEFCEAPVANVVSVEGSVEALRAGETEWEPVLFGDSFCPGDRIRVQANSRAAILLSNETLLRLDENTVVTFLEPEPKETSLLDLFIGVIHFISRVPRGLRVTTPYINAAIEGTEFLMVVEEDRARITVFEGRVVAANEFGSLTLTEGQSAEALAGQAPVLRIAVRPRDAVQWALYYPPILDYRPGDFAGGADWQVRVRQSIQFYNERNLAQAFAVLEGAPEDISDPRFYLYRAALLLSVGRVEKAQRDIEKALSLDPRNSSAFALQSMIAVVQNDKDRALSLAQKAVEVDPQSASARLALSYALQARFEVQGALASLREAVKRNPENSLVRARLSEMWLSVGNLGKAVETAKKAVKLNPKLARTQTVLGFAYLDQIKIREARKAFEEAIQLDQADPLPHLGLGLTILRDGDLKKGRRELEIAASLDPNTSLIRSYLGKAYYEEKRDKPAGKELATAKELDPQDPTPWFYDAIRKQTMNRPVEALRDLERSLELNNNRAVYRSRLLLEEDLAARSAGLSRIYHDLGFEQLALVEGWRSVNTDPANYSAHRLLADSYAALPRHEIARVSELLQSQLLQPLNITPIQPELAETNLFILSGAGPTELSFNEFNPLFNRNRFALQIHGIAGENNTFGNEIIHSAVQGRLSYSIGQFHYETEGFRENNDQNQDIYNVFTQLRLSPEASIQAELRYRETEKGDLGLRFDPNNFNPTLRQKVQPESIRLGFHQAFTSRSDLLAYIIYQNRTEDVDFTLDSTSTFEETLKSNDYMAEIQHLFRFERFNLISGIGYFNSDLRTVVNFLPFFSDTQENLLHHTNPYVYSQIDYPKNMIWTLGGSGDFFEGVPVDRNQFNPKLGLTWNPLPTTTLRAAVFRVLKKSLILNQTLEPTQVAGFNQFFDDGPGTESWRYGIAVDQKLPAQIYAGAEFSKRDLNVPFEKIMGPIRQIQEANWEEHLGRSYLYWTPQVWLAVSTEYQYERFERPLDATGPELITELRTHRLPLGVSFFHPSGFKVRLKATYVNQKGNFVSFGAGPIPIVTPDADQFWVIDTSIGYRLPRRWGLLTLEAKNLFNEAFKFQDTDPENPQIEPKRLVFVRLTLAF